MPWYLVQTKPRSENIAFENLSNQGYECYLPMLRVERLIKNKVEVKKSPLFPRYLFINLGSDFVSKSWVPIRSTKGVSNLIKFGDTLARIDEELLDVIRRKERQEESKIEPLFKKGQSLNILQGPFVGFESIYQGMDAEMRIIVLLDFMRKPVTAHLDIRHVRGY